MLRMQGSRNTHTSGGGGQKVLDVAFVQQYVILMYNVGSYYSLKVRGTGTPGPPGSYAYGMCV